MVHEEYNQACYHYRSLHVVLMMQGFKTVKKEILDEELQKSRPYRTPGRRLLIKEIRSSILVLVLLEFSNVLQKSRFYCL